MSIVSSIFVLKPIIDLLHADVLQYTDQIRVLKARVEELEKDNAVLREAMTKTIKVEPKAEKKAEKKAELKEVVIVQPKRKPVMGAIDIKDDDYAKQAETFEPVNVVVVPSVVVPSVAVPSVQSSTDNKVVVLQDEKTHKDYQKEYQRRLRQQKKEKANKN